jgi:WD40 repeat protein
MVVPTLRLLNAEKTGAAHGGDVLASCFTPDGQFVLSAGWDGCLRLWETDRGSQVSALKVGPKPLSACAVSPDGKHWLSGSMEGLLAQWDAVSHRQLSLFLAHTRPISAIVFGGQGKLMATTSWDRQVILWDPAKEREGRTLHGHADIVAGGRYTPDGRHFLSWSYDGSVRLWEVSRARLVSELNEHADRVTAGAVCPEGHWLASGSRDHSIKLWDLSSGSSVGSLQLAGEIRACFFLLDAVTLVTVDSNGLLQIHSVPDLEPLGKLATRLPVQTAELSPSGAQIALGCADGRVYLVAVDGFDSVPLLVTPTQTGQKTANVFQRLLGKSRVTYTYQCTCPACRQSFELPSLTPLQSPSCPHCRRSLRFSSFTKVAKEAVGRS